MVSMQEALYDAHTEHAVKVNKYAQTQKKRILSEINFLLNEIKEELLKGKKEVNLTDVRAMVKTADKLFKDGYAIIKNNIFDDAYELLEIEINGQAEMLQTILDDYSVGYIIKTPNINRTKKRLEELPLENITITGWLDLWEQKTRRILSTELLSNYGQFKEDQPEESDTPVFKDRYDIIDSVFGTEKNPLAYSTFLRTGADIGALMVSLTDSINAETTSSIGNSNHGIIIGEVWNSCLCSTTCGSCASLHGQVRYYSGEDETNGNEIPLHPNCQCFWTYKLREANKMDAKIKKSDQENINSNTDLKNGRLWYNEISKERQVDLFGSTRVKMLESNEITFNQLLNPKDRRIYSLAELQEQGYRVPRRTN